jgi:hypothetical protein
LIVSQRNKILECHFVSIRTIHPQPATPPQQNRKANHLSGQRQVFRRSKADAFLGAHPDFSDRQLARLAGVSHTFIAMRRKVTVTYVVTEPLVTYS